VCIESYPSFQEWVEWTVLQNDILPEAKWIAELNHWDHNFHLNDIRVLLEENFTFPTAGVITGGFPCQDFSHAGKRKGFDVDRGTLYQSYQSYVKVVKRVRQFLFVVENVNGLLIMPGNTIDKIMDDFTLVGYEVKYQLSRKQALKTLLNLNLWNKLDKIHSLF